MAITESDVLDTIRESVGDVDAVTGDFPNPPSSGVIYRGIETWWAMHESKDLVVPGLRAAYTRRDAVRRCLAVLAQKRFDVADNLSGLSIRGKQIFDHYKGMLDETLAEIKALESRATVSASSASGSGAIGRMETTLTPAPHDHVDTWMQEYRDLYAASLEE